MDEKPRFSFHFHPKGFEDKTHAVLKEEGGYKRRYLVGIASGKSIDGHGERMTEKAIGSFQNQAKSGNILLYEGQHGVNYIDDIGKLTGSNLTYQPRILDMMELSGRFNLRVICRILQIQEP